MMTNTPSDAEIVALAISEGIKVRPGAGAVRLVRAALAKWGTPQPVVREPAAYVHVPHYTVEGKVRPVVSFEKYRQDYADGIYSTRIPLYAAPQPAPAPLSEREAFERDWEKRHAPVPTNGRTHDDGRYGDSSIQDAWESWQARAAIAARGNK